jgi:2-polyprenyl-6-methoxyphenol hydroxylase-like FAD-dependent oxidoreductase
VDENGRRKAGFSYDLLRKLQKGRVFSFMRGDLERALYEALPETIDTRFATTISEIENRADGVDVTLTGGERVSAELLVGAGGVHSTVRAQLFGPEENFFRYLGYHVAAYVFESEKISRELGQRFVLHSVPKWQVGLYAIRGGRIATFFGHSDPSPELPDDPLARLREVYGDMGWLVPETLEAGEGKEIYYDQVAQIEMESWTAGRAVMVGDAAYAVSLLAGQGASLAMGGAYVLAEELRKAGNIDQGLKNYEARLKPAIAKKQAAGRNAAAWIMPEDNWHIVVRDWTMRSASLPGMGFLMGPVLVAGSESVVE